MGQSTVVTGIILHAAPIGEYDKRLVILTKERGKITAFAKGARRQNSCLMAAANPFVFGEFELYEGRSSYTISKASIQNYFFELVNNFEGAYYGFYFMEFADYYTRENSDEIMMLKLLYQSLRALAKDNLSNELIRCIFELKAVTINGEYPQVFQCICCEKEENISYFSAKHGGILCGECVKPDHQAVRISNSTVYAMQFIISSPIEKLFTFKVSDQVLDELKIILKKYLKVYIDKQFKSLPILDGIVTF